MYSDGPVAHDCYLSLCIWWLVSVSSNSNWSVIATAMEQQHLLYAVFLAFVAVSPYCVRYATGTAVPFILFQNILFHITICYLTRFFLSLDAFATWPGVRLSFTLWSCIQFVFQSCRPVWTSIISASVKFLFLLLNVCSWVFLWSVLQRISAK